MQRNHVGGDVIEHELRAPDLGGAREKGQHVAGLLGQCLADGGRNRGFDPGARTRRGWWVATG